MSFPCAVKIVEVSPRDGLQNEPGKTVSIATKVELIERLAKTGIRHIEVASFVSPKRVPQMADGGQVVKQLRRQAGVVYAALIPNLHGLEAAIAAGADEVAVFTAASESFTKHNIQCSIAESLKRFEPVIERATKSQLRVRGYVSTVLGCPYQGEISPKQVADVCADLFELGCYEISLGDTIGVGTTLNTKRMLEAVNKRIPINHLAAHFHDTYGQALVNLYAVLEEGLSVIDSSVAGLGGCPYAPGASGNVATEDVVYMLHGMNINTGIDLNLLISTGDFIAKQLGHNNHSKTAKAILIKSTHNN